MKRNLAMSSYNDAENVPKFTSVTLYRSLIKSEQLENILKWLNKHAVKVAYIIFKV